MHKIILFTASFSLLLLSCSDEQVKKSKSVTHQQNDEEQAIETKPTESNVEQLTKEKPTDKIDKNDAIAALPDNNKKKATALLKKHDNAVSISLNNRKFTLHSTNFEKGAKVYNIQRGDYGIVKGSIVVISIDNAETKDIQYSSTTVTKIAKNTFRLIPKSNQSLMAFYNKLIESERYSIIEMEINYNSSDKAAEFE